MFLKIMGRESAGDNDSRKTFSVHAHVASVEFVREGGKSTAKVMFDDESSENFDVPGNAYLLNDNGDTIAPYGSARAA